MKYKACGTDGDHRAVLRRSFGRALAGEGSEMEKPDHAAWPLLDHELRDEDLLRDAVGDVVARARAA